MESFDRKQNPTLATSRSRNSTSPERSDELTSDQGGAMFPETEMQLQMILRKASETSRNDAQPQVMMDQSKLIVLQDRFTVIQKRNVVLITENESLRSLLKESSDKIRELEGKRNLSSESGDAERQKKNVADRCVATTDFLVTMERGIQACEENFEDRNSVEATTIMTRSELDKLEMEMRRLKDAIATRESDWERAIERENCYREQLKRLASASMTSRQISESRHAELERLAQTLAETERELRSAHKEISGLKKITVKQDKRQRELEAHCTDHEINKAQTEISEKELRWIEDIVKQLSNAKNKHKSKHAKDKAIYTSGTNPSSNRSSPRSPAPDKSIIDDEPLTVTQILSKSL